MNYYCAQFHYSGSKVTLIGENDASDRAGAALLDAERRVIKELDTLPCQHVHAYAWPDGSLYRYVRVDGDPDEFREALKEALDKHGMFATLGEVDPERDDDPIRKKPLRVHMDEVLARGDGLDDDARKEMAENDGI